MFPVAVGFFFSIRYLRLLQGILGYCRVSQVLLGCFRTLRLFMNRSKLQVKIDEISTLGASCASTWPEALRTRSELLFGHL